MNAFPIAPPFPMRRPLSRGMAPPSAVSPNPMMLPPGLSGPFGGSMPSMPMSAPGVPMPMRPGQAPTGSNPFASLRMGSGATPMPFVMPRGPLGGFGIGAESTAKRGKKNPFQR